MSDKPPIAVPSVPPIAGKRCKCGILLPDSVFYRTGMYAASVEDANLLSQRKPTEHDVIGGNGRRLRIGACTSQAM